MGYSMANNWVSKRIAGNSNDSDSLGFVVCDVDHARATSFAKMFGEINPGAYISVAATPAE